jgi:uncharacterized membrane protein
MQQAMVKVLVGAALATGAAAAFASTPAAPAQKEKLVCREQAKTGSRFTKRECRTAEQWEAMAEQHRRSGKEMIDRPVVPITNARPG